jgi:hypothetical protein
MIGGRFPKSVTLPGDESGCALEHGELSGRTYLDSESGTAFDEEARRGQGAILYVAVQPFVRLHLTLNNA